MKTRMLIGIAVTGLVCLPSLSLGQEPAVTGEQSVSFPPHFACSANSPCRNITGEIMRIEESYWIKTPEGRETHMKVTSETKMEALPKVGDRIAAQVTSTGDANAIVALDEIPKPKDLGLPPHSQKEVRESLSHQSAGKPKPTDAESTGKVQKDPFSDSGNMDPASQLENSPNR